MKKEVEMRLADGKHNVLVDLAEPQRGRRIVTRGEGTERDERSRSAVRRGHVKNDLRVHST